VGSRAGLDTTGAERNPVHFGARPARGHIGTRWKLLNMRGILSRCLFKLTSQHRLRAVGPKFGPQREQLVPRPAVGLTQPRDVGFRGVKGHDRSPLRTA
jgi:hypothetical protein